jgi:transcriptional regulator with XRE-family HTH domain
MNLTDHETERWDRPGYADLLDAAISDDYLDVHFADGDSATVPLTLVGLPHDGASAHLNDEDGGLSVVLTAGRETRVISGLHLRSITDPAFAHEMRRRDAESARRMGLRLKALREDRGLNQRDLASLVGMSPPQLSKIESGTYDLRVSTVRTLLRAMGADFSDISESDAPEQSQQAIRKRLSAQGVAPELLNRMSAACSRKSFLHLVERAFGWSALELAASEPLTARPLQLQIKFKTRSAASATPSQS